MGHQPTTKRSRVAGLAAAAILAFAAACGGGGGAVSQDESGTSQVEVGIIPVSDVAVLYLGQEKGFFERRGITLNFHMAQGGAAVVPGVVSGEYNLGFSNVISLLQAHQRGLPVTMIAPAASSTGAQNGADDINPIMSLDDSIQTAEDLEGKRVGVNTLDNLVEILATASIEAAGVDPATVQFTEVPIPDNTAAASNGSIDAWVCAEPFCTAAEDQGAHFVANPFYDLAPGEHITPAAYFTTDEQIQRNPEVFQNLQAAINESLTYASEHPDEFRAQIPKFTEIDEGLIQRMTLSEYAPGLEPSELSVLAEAAVEYGVLDQQPNLDELVWRAEP